MSSAQNVRVDLVLKNLPDIACFESPLDWFKAIPDYIGGQVSSSVSNVVVSNVQPTDSQTTSVWFRVNNAGSFVGIYVFSGGNGSLSTRTWIRIRFKFSGCLTLTVRCPMAGLRLFQGIP